MLSHRAVATLGIASLLAGCANGPGPFGVGALFNDRTLAAAEPLFGRELDRCLDDPAFLLRIFRKDGGGAYVPDRMRDPERQARQAYRCMREAQYLHDSLDLQDVQSPSQIATNTTASYTVRAGELTNLAPGAPRPAGRTVPVTIVSTAVTKQPDTADAAPLEQPLRYTKLERNEIIDALIAASDRKCGRYTEYLKTYDGSVNTGFAVASIVTAGLGGIVGGVKTAKALSGSSAILNGSRASLNEIHFANQTIQVLAQAYGKERDNQRRELSNREACPVVHYSLMRGFQDALAYHNACSITTGLQATAAAVQRADNPGVDTLRRSLAELSALRRAAGYFANPDEPIALGSKSPTLDELVRDKGEADTAAQNLETEKANYNTAVSARTGAIDAVTQKDATDSVAIAAVTTAQDTLVAAAKAKLDKAQSSATAAADKAQNTLTKLAAEPAKLRNAQEDVSTQSKTQYAACPFTAHDHDENDVPTAAPAAAATPADGTTGTTAKPDKSKPKGT